MNDAKLSSADPGSDESLRLADYSPRLKSDRKRRNTLRTSRKIEAARSGAVRMSSVRRSRWKSYIVRPAKMPRPATA